METNLSSTTQATFNIVALALLKTAQRLHTTYNAINIIVYYLLVPLVWTVMLDFKLQQPITTTLLVAVWTVLIIATRHHFLAWCDRAFKLSQQFLLLFQRIGWNYVVSSVIICVILPILITIALIII